MDSSPNIPRPLEVGRLSQGSSSSQNQASARMTQRDTAFPNSVPQDTELLDTLRYTGWLHHMRELPTKEPKVAAHNRERAVLGMSKLSMAA